jgi:hypothetical protein
VAGLWQNRPKDNRRPLLGQGEGANELQAVALLRVTFTHSGVGAAAGGGRLRTPESRRHHDLVLEDEVDQVKVVAINLPAPWFVHGGSAKDAEEVKPFPKQLSVAGDFPQHFVELHDVARRLEAPHAHPEQLSCRISLGWAHLVERHAVAQRMPNKPTCAWCCAVAQRARLCSHCAHDPDNSPR